MTPASVGRRFREGDEVVSARCVGAGGTWRAYAIERYRVERGSAGRLRWFRVATIVGRMSGASHAGICARIHARRLGLEHVAGIRLRGCVGSEGRRRGAARSLVWARHLAGDDQETIGRTLGLSRRYVSQIVARRRKEMRQ